jgi:hypothetical protein
MAVMTRAECPHCTDHPIPELERLADPDEPWEEHDNEECDEHPCPSSPDGQHLVGSASGLRQRSEDTVEISFGCACCDAKGFTSVETEWIYWREQ